LPLASRSTKALEALIAEYSRLKAIIDEAEGQLAPVKEQLGQVAAEHGGVAETPTHIVKLISQERKMIEKEKLLERGVAPAIIEYATRTTPSVYARVWEKKETA
jgi:hypothetical protein